MATTPYRIVRPVPITKLPPGPERDVLKSHQHFNRRFPVYAAYAGHDEYSSSGVSYEDFGGMQCFTAKLSAGRRLETPQWAVNDAMLRDVILRYVEQRAYNRNIRYCDGTPEERLQFALQHCLKKGIEREACLTKLCKRLVEMKTAGASAAKIKRLEESIENLDTTIMWTGKEDKLAAGVVYRYYRQGLNSTEIAEAMQIKPPHVRQIVWRLTRYAEDIAGGKTNRFLMKKIREPREPKTGAPPKSPKQTEEKTCLYCGQVFMCAIRHPHQKFCKKRCKKDHENAKKRAERLRLRGACGDCKAKFKELNLDKLTGAQAQKDMAWLRERLLNAPSPCHN